MFNPLVHTGDTLKKVITGDVWLDMPTREQFSTATCMYKVMPIGVVAPKQIDDVQRLVRFCTDNQISIVPRGGATGLVGQAIGSGIVADFTKHLNRIIGINKDQTTVTLQPGCILDQLTAYLRERNKFYPVDPQSMKTCTLGGNIATNAAGPHGIKYGSTKDHISELTVILSNGDAATLTNDRVISSDASTIAMFEAARQLLAGNEKFIKSRAPKVAKNSSGYNIYDSINDGQLNPVRLFCGSEGTLGIIAEATLKIYEQPRHNVSAVVYCSGYEQTAQAVQFALSQSPSAVELLDKSYTVVGKGIDPSIDALISHDFQSMLIIEMDGNDRDAIINQLNRLLSNLLEQKLITTCQILLTEKDRSALWMLREEVSQRLNTNQDQYQKASFIEDGTVPVSNLPEFMTGVKTILDTYKIPFSLYGHAGTGNIHCATFVDFTTEGRRIIEAAAVDVFDLLLSLDGSFSGEHGDGFVRTPFLEKEFGPEIYRIFTEIKNIFDPHNIFNPGKIVGKQDGNFLHDIKYV